MNAELACLNTRIKSVEDDDTDEKGINTWNDYPRRLKNFFRWLHNAKSIDNETEEISTSTANLVLT